MNITNDIKSMTYGILKLISQGEADIRKWKVKNQDDIFNDLEVKLKEKLK